MKRALRPRLEPRGPEGIPLVGVRPSSTTGTLLRGGSCVGDPKVRLTTSRQSEDELDILTWSEGLDCRLTLLLMISLLDLRPGLHQTTGPGQPHLPPGRGLRSGWRGGPGDGGLPPGPAPLAQHSPGQGRGVQDLPPPCPGHRQHWSRSEIFSIYIYLYC